MRKLERGYNRKKTKKARWARWARWDTRQEQFQEKKKYIQQCFNDDKTW